MPQQGRKFVIIGGAGLIGSNLAHTLIADHSCEIVICDQFGSIQSQKWANLPSGIDDIWKPETLLSNLDKAWREVAGVVHLADTHDADDCDLLFEAHYHLPRRLWDFCVAKQRPLAWASSSHVYGDGVSNLSRDANDVAALRPINAFGKAKHAFDVFAARQGRGPDAPPRQLGLRLSSIYSSSEAHKGNYASLPAQALHAARHSKSLKLWQDSETITRDWIHVGDAAKAIASLATKEADGFYDIGTGQSTTTRALLGIVQDVSGKTLDIRAITPPEASARSLAPANLLPLLDIDPSLSFRTIREGLSGQ